MSGKMYKIWDHFEKKKDDPRKVTLLILLYPLVYQYQYIIRGGLSIEAEEVGSPLFLRGKRKIKFFFKKE